MLDTPEEHPRSIVQQESRLEQLLKELERCDREKAAIKDYNCQAAWLNAIGEADWEAEKFLILKEIDTLDG